MSLKPQQQLVEDSLKKAFADLLEDCNYILGSRVQTFEHEFANYCQTRFCIGVASGLDALTIALKSLRLERGDEVIVPANTYLATWLAVSNAGLTVIPVEPDADTYNLDPGRVREAITERTRVILPVHLYGQACDMTSLTEIARSANIEIVEDNAQAHGAEWRSRKTGSWGRINATSFYPTKNLGALGDGGAITTSDDELARLVQTYRNYGSDKKNYFEMQGMNSRLDEVQAAFLSLKLRELDRWNQERQSLAALYHERLSATGEIKLPDTAEGASHVFHLYVVKCARRDALKHFLMRHGIETMVHYPVPPHLQKAYQQLNLKKGQFPITEMLADSVLSLPLWPGMSVSDIDYVSEKIVEFYR